MDARPAKRARQACEPCRRKKSRCPGEKPTCSFCARLKQSCNYNDDGNSSTESRTEEYQLRSVWEDKFGTLEAKVDLVLNRILSQPIQPVEPPVLESTQNQTGTHFQPALTTPTSLSTIHAPSHENVDKSFTQKNCLPPHIILGLVDIYIRRCDCQPLSLFDVEILRQNIDLLNPEVLSSILALSLRFLESLQISGDPVRLANEYAEQTRQIVVGKIMEGDTQITTLQALCLNAFYDHTSGNSQRAWLSIGIGMRIITSIQVPIKSESPADQTRIDEYRRCLWGFYFLECLCSDASKVHLSLPYNKPPYPPSLSIKFEHGTQKFQPSSRSYTSTIASQDNGIIGCFFQLVELWKNVLQYIIRSLDATETPWSPGSGYTDMSAMIMEWESLLCKNHRSAHAMFSEQSPTDISINSRYWAPWLNVQFTYHCTLTLINNPFYLLCKVLSNKGVASTSFLETASDLAFLHAKHIVRLVETLKNRQFAPADPFLAYCAAVAAMTHLWHCRVENREGKEQAQMRYITCYNFVETFTKKWPIVQVIADNLTQLNKRSQSWEVSPTTRFTPLKIPAPDLSLIWDLLSYPPRAHNQPDTTIDKSTSSSTIAKTRDTPVLKQCQTPIDIHNTFSTGITSTQYPIPFSSDAPEICDRNGSEQRLEFDNLGFDSSRHLFENQVLESEIDWNWYNIGNL